MDVIFTVEGSGYENKSEKSVHVDLGGQVMTGESSQQSTVTTATIKEKFGPIFALKLVDSHFNSTSKRLSPDEEAHIWDALKTVLPEILSHCSGICSHPDNEKSSTLEMLWDFMNGREICIGVNSRGGYDLSIRASEIQWDETQLPLDLLLLKLLALDYTPQEFRDYMN
jgi:hypothetical protein